MTLTDLLNDYNRDDLYHILLKNNFYLPCKTSQWLTKKVML